MKSKERKSEEINIMSRRLPWLAVGLAIAFMQPANVRAETVADFYKGKDITFIVSAGEGGGYAAYARTFAPYLGNALPGKPKIIVKHMPGAGGIRASLFLFSTAPRDGSAIGLVHSGVPLAPVFGIRAARFDARQFNWLGAMARSEAVCVAWHTAPIKNAKDLFDKQFVVGGTGGGSQMETYPAMLNKLFGTKIKIVSGYKGGNSVYLAMERGEVQGRCGGGLNSIRSTRPDWLKDKKVGIPIVFATQASKEAPGVSTVMDLAKDARTTAIIELVLAPQEMDRPVLAPPGVPAERVAALRKAFAEAITQKAFLADMSKQGLDVEAVTGEAVARIIASAYAAPDDVKIAAREALAMGEKKKPAKK